jgi:hypothetical protein
VVGGTVKLAGVFEPALPELEAEAELMASRTHTAGNNDGYDEDSTNGDPELLDAAGAMRWVQQLEAFVSEVQAFEQLLAARARRTAEEQAQAQREMQEAAQRARAKEEAANLDSDPRPQHAGRAKQRGGTRSWKPG